MTPGQTRVVVLLFLLFLMEMAVNPAIKPWLKQVKSYFNAQLGGK